MLRLRQIALVARELDPVLTELHDALGVEVAFRDPSVKTFGLQNAVMPIGNQFLEVVAPVQEGTAAGRYLDRRKGDGGYMVILQCDEHAARKARLGEELGVRFAMAHDSDDYKVLQLHPQDTGGSFLEVDQQTGGEDMVDGPWEPAGPNWQHARRTGIVGGINAAVIQSDDPVRLATRWSELLDVPVEGDDNPSIPLDNATLMFVKAADGRGEGLAGLYLAPGNDPQAPKRVQICGMDIQVEGAAPA
ncbi:MAG: hypothetical protein JWM12_4241 [Ilumatobacteraceae bacterium]|nr:hypothetical protein [Ilumatobacteraceae bacterium]